MTWEQEVQTDRGQKKTLVAQVSGKILKRDMVNCDSKHAI